MMSPERPSETNTAGGGCATRALESLVRAATQWALYGREHPISRQACDEAAQAIAAMMAARQASPAAVAAESLTTVRPQFSLVVTDSGLAAGDEPLPDRAALRQLRDNLHRRQIAAVMFSPGLVADEVLALISLLATDPVELANAGGARLALMDNACQHIDIAEVDYSRYVPESQARWLSSFSGGPGSISNSVQSLVSVCIEIPGDRLHIADKGAMAERGVPMPFPVPIMLPTDGKQDFDGAALREQLAALQGVSPDDYLAVGLAWLIQASGEAVMDAPPRDRKAWRETVKHRIAELDLGLQARIFRAPRQAASAGPDALAALAADRSPEQIADLIVARPAAVVGEPSALLERILRRTLCDQRKLLAVEPLLRQRLMQRGMSQDSFRNVVGLLLDQIATDLAMHVEGTAQWLGDFDHAPPTQEGGAEEWPDLVATISDEAVAQARARVLLAVLPYPHDAGRYLDLVSFMEACVAARCAAPECGQAASPKVARPEGPPSRLGLGTATAAGEVARPKAATAAREACLAAASVERLAAGVAGDALEWRAAPSKDAVALDIIEALAQETDSSDVVRANIATAALQRLATPQVAAAMKSALAQAPPEQRPRFITIIGKMGNECADILLAQAERADDPQLRALAVRALADAGERGAAEIRHLLAHGPLDQVIFAATALIEGGAERFLRLLAAGFDHRQPLVRTGLAERLAGVGGLVSEQLLIRAMYDEDLGVQCRAAQSLGEMRAAGAVHALGLAARKGALHGRVFEVRKAAVQALGKIAAPDAVPALREILRRRSLLFRERAEELSAMAAAALAAIPGPEARQALQEHARPRGDADRAAGEAPAGVARAAHSGEMK